MELIQMNKLLEQRIDDNNRDFNQRVAAKAREYTQEVHEEKTQRNKRHQKGGNTFYALQQACNVCQQNHPGTRCPPKCYNCQQFGHMSRECSKPRGNGNNRTPQGQQNSFPNSRNYSGPRQETSQNNPCGTCKENCGAASPWHCQRQCQRCGVRPKHARGSDCPDANITCTVCGKVGHRDQNCLRKLDNRTNASRQAQVQNASEMAQLQQRLYVMEQMLKNENGGSVSQAAQTPLTQSSTQNQGHGSQ